MTPDPFDALGLPARPDLTDEQVRAAWRAIAAATHPDRPDGGDLARYTQAPPPTPSCAPPGAAARPTPTWPSGPDRPGRRTPRRSPVPPEPRPDRPPPWLAAARWLQLPARIWHGRPLRLLIRGRGRRRAVPGRAAR